jgi:hypothetical protein
MSMSRSCIRHHLQGVWGRATPPNGEREGRSPLASKHYRVSSGEREGRSPLAKMIGSYERRSARAQPIAQYRSRML